MSTLRGVEQGVCSGYLLSRSRKRQITRRTRRFRLRITGLNLSSRVPTPSVEPRTRPLELFLQLRKTYGPWGTSAEIWSCHKAPWGTSAEIWS